MFVVELVALVIDFVVLFEKVFVHLLEIVVLGV